MSEVFDELKLVIRRSGMGAEAIGWKAGCSATTIHHWLAGDVKEPNVATLVKVAKVFGRSIELADGELRLVDTPASVTAKMAGARQFVGLWRRWQ